MQFIPTTLLTKYCRIILLFFFGSFCFNVSSAQDIRAQVAKLPIYINQGICKQDWLLGDVKIKSAVSRSTDGKSIVLSNGLVRRVFKTDRGCATVALDNLMTGQSELRAVRPEATLTINSKVYNIGGLKGQPVQNYLSTNFINDLKRDPDAFQLTGFTQSATVERFPWKRNEAWSTQKLPWPAPGVRLTFNYTAPDNAPENIKAITVKIIYELYDGMPVISKWMEVNNKSKSAIELNSFKSEVLALTETAPKVDRANPGSTAFLVKIPLPKKIPKPMRRVII